MEDEGLLGTRRRRAVLAREGSAEGRPPAAAGSGDTAAPRGVRDDDAGSLRYAASRVRPGLRDRQMLTAGDRRRQHRSPGPARRQADHDPAARPHQTAGHVQERVAQTRRRGLAPPPGQT